jgi:hypothetical protein
MSAINPASFASPSLGIQAPSGIGPGAVGANRQSQIDRRPASQQQQQQQQQQEHAIYHSHNPPNRGYQAAAGTGFGTLVERATVTPTGSQQPGFTYGYPPFAGGPRNSSSPMGVYAPNMLPQMDSFGSFTTASEFSPLPGRFPSPQSVAVAQDTNEYSRQGNGTDGWMNSFQGLSLNTR